MFPKLKKKVYYKNDNSYWNLFLAAVKANHTRKKSITKTDSNNTNFLKSRLWSTGQLLN